MLIKTINFALNILFPKTETEKILEKITAKEIYNRCQKNFENKDLDVFSIFKYKDPFIKDAVYELKNNKNKYAIELFAEILKKEIFKYLKENKINEKEILVSFIPQHKSKYLDKGYNQGEKLAAALCAAAPTKFKKVNLLIKTKNTKAQHDIQNKKSRLNNLKGAFKIAQGSSLMSHGKLIILIDDVYTTGATLKESRRVLIQSGLKQVVCFTVAH